MTGFALDTGRAYIARKELQQAADAAALAGAHELFRGNSHEAALAAAQAGAAANGYANGVDNVVVTVNHPPSSGFYTSNNMSVEVLVNQPTQASLLEVLGISELGVGVRAVANGDLADSRNCIYALHPTDENSFHVTSDSILNAGCGIQVNSNDGNASVVESGACVYTPFIGITGGYSAGQVCDQGGDAYQCSEADTCPTTEVPPAPDPLASIPPPLVDYSSCDYGSYDDGYEVDLDEGSDTITLDPGTYCDGIEVKKGTVTFNPGVYVIRGGGLKVTGGEDAHIEGSGVTFYITCYDFCDGSEDDEKEYGAVEIASGSSATLAAPTSGSLEGMLFFQDRDAPESADRGAYPKNLVDSGSVASFEGAIYFPNQHFQFHSDASGATPDYMLIVTLYLEISSGSDLQVNNNYGALANSSPLKRVTLVE